MSVKDGYLIFTGYEQRELVKNVVVSHPLLVNITCSGSRPNGIRVDGQNNPQISQRAIGMLT